MIKKHNASLRVGTLSLLLLIGLAISSCKKEFFKDNQIESAKAWYSKSTKPTTLLKSSNNREKQLNKEVNWDEANLRTLENGIAVVTAPMSVEYSNDNAPAIGSYMLIVYKTKEKYSSAVVYNSKNDYYNENLSETELTGLYSNALMQTMSRLNSNTFGTKKSKGGHDLKNAPAPVCIDWYWTETTYDDYGNIIDYDEFYVYSTCSDPNETPGGGGGTDEDDIVLDLGSPSSQELGSAAEEDYEVEGSGGPSTIPGKWKELNWKFFDFTTFYEKSTEKGVIKIIDGQRSWHSLTHLSTISVGFWALGSVKVIDKSFQPVIYGQSATMWVDYRVEYTPLPSIVVKTKRGVDVTISLPPWPSDWKYSGKSWNTYFNASIE